MSEEGTPARPDGVTSTAAHAEEALPVSGHNILLGPLSASDRPEGASESPAQEPQMTGLPQRQPSPLKDSAPLRPTALVGGTEAPVASVAKEPVMVGPCLCARGSEGGHKTVNVESRCWPGINKPGGVARITNKTVVEEEIFGEKVNMTYYDVKYLLGGREKRVKATYIKCTQEDGASARQSCPRDIFTVTASESSRRSRPGAKIAPLALTPKATPSKARSKSSKSKVEDSSRASPSSPLGQIDLTNTSRKTKGKPKMMKAKRSSSTEGARSSMKKACLDGMRGAGSSENSRPSLKMGGKAPSSKGNEERSKFGTARSSAAISGDGSEDERPKPFPQMTDLLAPVVAVKGSEPLADGRYGVFSTAMYALFNKTEEDSMSLAAVKAGVNKLVPGPEAFNDKEIDLALCFLEEVEIKVMVSEGVVYRI